MDKIYIQNMGMFVTEKCNLNCAHCCRGTCTNKSVSDEVIKKTLEQILIIGTLTICGGEPTLAVDRIEKLFSTIIDNKILIENVYMYLNGTNYSEELIRLCKLMNEYLQKVNRLQKRLCNIEISCDEFHIKELKKRNKWELYKDNCTKYLESGYFNGLRELVFPVFREGNALNMDQKLTIPIPIMSYVMTYVGNDKRKLDYNGLCHIGPLVSVNVDGIVTECDGSWKNQRSIYNYGNIFDDSIENIVLKNGAKVLKPTKWYKETGKLMKKYLTAK